jgi:MarR family transcriptional regulator, organic hydroperoxide resistance regulator
MTKRSRKPANGSLDIELQDFLPYLFHLIAARLSGHFIERLRPYGVTVQRWRVLMVVMNKGPRNVGELVELTLIPQSALSRVIDQMERDGLVVRQTSERDNRVVEVHLTKHGRETYRQLAPAAIGHAEAIVAKFGDKDRSELFRLLRHVLRNLEIKTFSDASRRNR